jgi:hypothetical protein
MRRVLERPPTVPPLELAAAVETQLGRFLDKSAEALDG